MPPLLLSATDEEEEPIAGGREMGWQGLAVSWYSVIISSSSLTPASSPPPPADIFMLPNVSCSLKGTGEAWLSSERSLRKLKSEAWWLEGARRDGEGMEEGVGLGGHTYAAEETKEYSQQTLQSPK